MEVLEETLIGVSADEESLEAVDTVSGATMTSDAIIEAILSALGLLEENDALDISLAAGAVYSVDITYKAAAHSLVSDPEATADDDTDTVSALIVVDTDGHASIVIDFYNSESMYITSYNGLYLGGTEEGELSTDGTVIYTAENEELEGGTYVTQVTIPLDDLYSVYYTSVSVYVPSMYNVDMDGDGEIDEGYFTVDPSTLTIDWDTLTLVEYISEEEEYDYAEDAVLGFHTVSAEYAGIGDYEGMTRVLYAIDKYLGGRVGVEELEDGTWNAIVYFGGEYGYNSAIGDLTVYESEDLSDEGTVISCGEDLTYVIPVDSLEDVIYVGLYVGGSMDLTVTYSITLNTSDYQGHSYELTATDDETGEETYTCTVCGASYIVEPDSTEETEEEETTEEETTTEASAEVESSIETTTTASSTTMTTSSTTTTTSSTTTTTSSTTTTTSSTTTTTSSTTTTASSTTTTAVSTTTAASSTTSDSAETSDSSSVMLYAALMMVALGACGAMYVVARKRKY